MSFKAKVTNHIQAAEQWQAKVKAFEEAAARQTPDAFEQAKILDRFDYRSAIANRNGHQQQAIMYGIAALLEDADRQRAERRLANPRQVFSSPPPDV